MNEPTSESTPLEKLVCDTSVVINLDTLGYINLVVQFYQVVIPHEVRRELQANAGRGKPGYLVPRRNNIDIRYVDFRIFNAVDKRLGEDKGETAAIALAFQLKSLAAIDEYRTRTFCSEQGIPYISTITLLEYIHDEGLSQRSMRDELTMLRAAGTTISDELFSSVVSRYE